LLWGKFAQAKEELIDTSKHHILKAAHPSPYSADNGFFSCHHFSKTNAILEQEGKQPIDWQIH
jgi:uracil-DNA glycosylase